MWGLHEMAGIFQDAYGNTFLGMEYRNIWSISSLVSSQGIQLAVDQLCVM